MMFLFLGFIYSCTFKFYTTVMFFNVQSIYDSFCVQQVFLVWIYRMQNK